MVFILGIKIEYETGKDAQALILNPPPKSKVTTTISQFEFYPWDKNRAEDFCMGVRTPCDHAPKAQITNDDRRKVEFIPGIKRFSRKTRLKGTKFIPGINFIPRR